MKVTGYVVSMALASFMALAPGAGPANAQDENPTTPGAIPNPGTYQGSMELQRQQDQQDHREQQQPAPAQQWGSPNGPQGYGWRGGPEPMPGTPCFQEVPRIASLRPLSDKVNLGPVDPNQVYLFEIETRPTAPEKTLLQKWLEARRYCRMVLESLPAAQTPKFRYVETQWGAIATERLIARLMAGELTYGQFNHQRAVNSVVSARWWNMH
jgi:hypothetical protein